MPQLSLYLDQPTMDHLRVRAEQESVSLSSYVGAMLRKHTPSAWPEGFWELYGSIKDDAFVEPDELDPSLDSPRNSF